MAKYWDIIAVRQAYSRGENVTSLLRRQLGLEFNTEQIIEIAYDLQAGSYIEFLKYDARTSDL